MDIYRPKRKKAFHRALRRGEGWAVMEESTRRLMNIISAAMFNKVQTSVFSRNALLSLRDGLAGEEFKIEVKTPQDTEKK